MGQSRSQVGTRKLFLLRPLTFDVRTPRIRYRLGRRSEKESSSPARGRIGGAEINGIAGQSVRNGVGDDGSAPRHLPR
jgi:hypothetical protein